LHLIPERLVSGPIIRHEGIHAKAHLTS
jgi:hypothetical protein